jgi:hypothetical protein
MALSLTLDSNAACNCACKLHCAGKLHYAFAAARATYNYVVPMISSDLLELLFSLVSFCLALPLQDFQCRATYLQSTCGDAV